MIVGLCVFSHLKVVGGSGGNIVLPFYLKYMNIAFKLYVWTDHINNSISSLCIYCYYLYISVLDVHGLVAFSCALDINC